MSLDKKFSLVLNEYNPNDKRSHAILKFFSEDLSESEKLKFITLIFNEGSWILPTEISDLSGKIEIKNYTNDKFNAIFSEWVSKRIEHSNFLTPNNKIPYVPIQFIIEFREALFSIRNLGFPNESMFLLENFLNECNTSYTKKFLEDSCLLMIEEFNTDEIEIFLSYFSRLYLKNNNIKFGNLFYIFLNSLAYSYKIFNLSSDFLKELNLLSQNLNKEELKMDYYNLISILLVEYIDKKNLDLSNGNFDNIIEETISLLEKGSHKNLDFYKFLKRFNYSFKNYDFNIEIKTLFEKIYNNINFVKNCDENQKKSILHHYIKSSEQYFELILFYIENCSNENMKIHLINFIDIIDELRESFTSFLWFEEYLNFTTIYGRIKETIPHGFNVEIDNDYFNSKIIDKNLQSICSKDFYAQYCFGFLKNEFIKEFDKSSKLYNLFDSEKIKSNKQELIKQANDINHEPFIISSVNYSSTNRWSIVSLIPFNKPLSDKIIRFNLKAFFSSVEIFLVEKAYEFLNLDSPFNKRTNVFDKIFPYYYGSDYNIKFSENEFWEILEIKRPYLFNSIYLKFKREQESFNKLVKAHEDDLIVKGKIKSRTNGGMFVEIFDLETFLPGSQIDVSPIRDYDLYLNKIMDFKIIKINHEIKNVVVSHKILLEKEIAVKKIEYIEKLEKGKIVEGIVKNITSYGVFIDLGLIDGLIHITDLSWSRINHPSDILEVDQHLKVVILDYDEDKTKIQLGLKQLNDERINLISVLNLGDVVQGKVVLLTEYGIFIKVDGGLEGLVHVSELSWSTTLLKFKNRQEYIQDKYSLGDEVKAKILTIDKDNFKISMSIKQLSENPWINFDKKYKKGNLIKCTIKEIVNYGLIVSLENDLEGLIHISEYTNFNIPSKTTKQILHLNNKYSLGQELDAILLSIESDKFKISLGLKQITENPWHSLVKEINPKYKVKGRVVKIFHFGIFIQLSNGLEGLLHVSDMTWYKLPNSQEEKYSYINNLFKIGDFLEVIVLKINKNKCQITFGLKQLRLYNNKIFS